jgi:outer membrane protein TolC
LKDWQQAQADAAAADNDLRSAKATLEAARNRLRILGKTDQEITAFQERAPSTRRPRSTRRSPGRSCSARSGRANTLAAERPILSS